MGPVRSSLIGTAIVKRYTQKGWPFGQSCPFIRPGHRNATGRNIHIVLRLLPLAIVQLVNSIERPPPPFQKGWERMSVLSVVGSFQRRRIGQPASQLGIMFVQDANAINCPASNCLTKWLT